VAKADKIVTLKAPSCLDELQSQEADWLCSRIYDLKRQWNQEVSKRQAAEERLEHVKARIADLDTELELVSVDEVGLAKRMAAKEAETKLFRLQQQLDVEEDTYAMLRHLFHRTAEDTKVSCSILLRVWPLVYPPLYWMLDTAENPGQRNVDE
jgi:chromosome segregation ATPase